MHHELIAASNALFVWGHESGVTAYLLEISEGHVPSGDRYSCLLASRTFDIRQLGVLASHLWQPVRIDVVFRDLGDHWTLAAFVLCDRAFLALSR